MAEPNTPAELLLTDAVQWLKDQCNRYTNGRCTTRRCLVRGGYIGPPADYNIATCEPHEITVALNHRTSAPAAGAGEAHTDRQHVDFFFDGTDCCKICGLVRPAEGWTRPYKGPSELSLRDTAPVPVGEDANELSEGPTGCLDDRDELSQAVSQLGEEGVNRVFKETLGQPAPTPLSCCYCGKDQEQVEYLVAATNGNICDRCVGICTEMIERDRRQSAPAAVDADAPPPDPPAADEARAGLREQLAALAHERWSGWMRYQFEKCLPDKDSYHVIPHGLAERWKRQAGTPYADLPENEKEFDRQEADRMLAIVDAALHATRDNERRRVRKAAGREMARLVKQSKNDCTAADRAGWERGMEQAAGDFQYSDGEGLRGVDLRALIVVAAEIRRARAEGDHRSD